MCQPDGKTSEWYVHLMYFEMQKVFVMVYIFG